MINTVYNLHKNYYSKHSSVLRTKRGAALHKNYKEQD